MRTVSARQALSWQLIQRGGPGADIFTTRDLLESVNAEQDRQVIAGSAAAELAGILGTASITTVAYTDATPTVAEFLPKLLLLAKQTAVARKRPPTAVVMHSRRWYWICAAMTTTNTTAIPVTATPPRSDSPFVGSVAGLGVLLDDNLPTNLGTGTNEDRVLVLRPVDLVVAESELRVSTSMQAAASTFAAAKTGFRYVVATAGRHPGGVGVLTGTGLVDPGTW